MSRPKLLDLYSCQGAASEGYRRAGFDVFGVDIDPQPRYPFRFHQGDALSVLRVLNNGGKVGFHATDDSPHLGPFFTKWLWLDDFSAIHGSPPCQAFTNAQKIQGNEHPELIGPTRDLLVETGLPYVIENVPGSPVRADVELCGATFGLHTYRHRLFESSIPLTQPAHRPHAAPTVKMGRPITEGDWYHAVGNFSGVDYIRRDLGVPWMTRDGIRECIPPAYTEHIGRQLMAHIGGREVAA